MIQKGICLPALRTIYFETHLWKITAPQVWQKVHFSFNDSLAHFLLRLIKLPLLSSKRGFKAFTESERKIAKTKGAAKNMKKICFGEGDAPHSPTP